MRNLDITALRSFVAVSEAGGVTRAAGFLNLTQSAVSMQIKRLEEMLGLKLLDRSGRGVTLTPSGQQLVIYARRIVDLNDEIHAKLTRQDWEGEITLGVPHDIIYPVIPNVIKRMQRDYPKIKLHLVSSFTYDLKAKFARGAIDVILTTEPEPDKGGDELLELPLRWYGAPGGQTWATQPLRVAFCNHCAFRGGVTEKLDAAGLDWELAATSDSDRAIEVAVSADQAVTAVLEGHEPAQYEEVPENSGLPELGMQKIILYASGERRQIVEPLLTFLRSEFGALQSNAADVAAQ
ncbi:MAG: LysR family transcriptional regulator [Paracoccaceae bacterium]|nr:LysR family transcriptional regulator [Paracoccaceae bacterium]